MRNSSNSGVKLEDLVIVLNSLSGKAHLSKIYKKIIEIKPNVVSLYKNESSYQASIRSLLERHSSDSKMFQEKADIFYLVEGYGKGIWGLRKP